MMKRTLTLVLVLTMCLGLVACGSSDEAEPEEEAVETQNPLEGISFYEMDSWGTIVPDDWTVSGDLNSPTFTAPPQQY